MEHNRQDLDEMYSSDDQGEYAPELGKQNFSIQGLSDTLTSLESETIMVQPPAEEYALLLEVRLNKGRIYHGLAPSLQDAL